MSNSNTQSVSSYINLHTTGIGFLNRIREVPASKRSKFWSCDVAAMHGSQDEGINYVNFQVNSANEEVDRLLSQAKIDSDDGKKIKAAFKIGDLYTEAFILNRGANAGKPSAVIKGRLLLITHLWVDNELVFQRGEQGENLITSKDQDPLVSEYQESFSKVAESEAIEYANNDVQKLKTLVTKEERDQLKTEMALRANANAFYASEARKIWPKPAPKSI